MTTTPPKTPAKKPPRRFPFPHATFLTDVMVQRFVDHVLEHVQFYDAIEFSGAMTWPASIAPAETWAQVRFVNSLEKISDRMRRELRREIGEVFATTTASVLKIRAEHYSYQRLSTMNFTGLLVVLAIRDEERAGVEMSDDDLTRLSDQLRELRRQIEEPRLRPLVRRAVSRVKHVRVRDVIEDWIAWEEARAVESRRRIDPGEAMRNPEQVLAGVSKSRSSSAFATMSA